MKISQMEKITFPTITVEVNEELENALVGHLEKEAEEEETCREDAKR